MTKSRTLRKAGAVALSLAMALSIAGTTPAQAASKVKLSSKKGTITVGKTKKVTIKNTKKSNIKKVTFKYSNTKKRVTAKRSGLTLKFKGNKAGTVTITSKITLKKAVAGKKTYSLKYKATVKKATPSPTATPGELKLDSVEAATRNLNQGVNVLVAYFSSAISNLNPSDIEIRNVKTNDLYTVEKVVMASDNKSATLTLTGSSTAGTAVQFLEYNTDYKMIVKNGGKVLEKAFTIPAVLAGQVVTKVVKTNKKITVNGVTEYTLSDDVAKATDFVQILGRSVTFTYDKNNVISKLALDDETVLYGAFKFVDTNNDKTRDSIQNLKDEKKYSIVTEAGKAAYDHISVTTGISNIYVSGEQVMDAKDGAGLLANNNTATVAADPSVEYAKVTLNGNGTVRSIISYNNFDKVEYAASTKETDLVKIDGKTESLKDFTVQKEDKDVAIAGIAAGDIVYFDSTSKNAIIYGSDTDKGKMSVYTGKFEVNTKRYDTGKSGYTVAQSIVADKKDTATTDAVLGKYKDTEVTVIFNWAGKVQKLTAGDVAAATSDVLGVVTTAGKLYTSGSKHLIDVSIDAGEGAKAYTIDVDKLESITDFAGVKATKDGTTINGFGVFTFDANGFTGSVKPTKDGAAVGTTDLEIGLKAVPTAKAALLKGDLVKLTTKADGTVVGIDCGGAGTAAGTGIKDSYIATAGTHRNLSNVTQINDSGTPANQFKGGQTKVNNGTTDFILGSSTTLLLYDGTKVTKKTYGDVDFTFGIDAGAEATAKDFGKQEGVVRYNGDKVDTILIYMGNAGIATTSTITKVGIVKDYTLSTDTTKKFVDITIAHDGASTTLKDFANDVTVTTKDTAARTAIGGGAAGTLDDWLGAADAKVAVGKLVFVTETKEGKVTNISLGDSTMQAAVQACTLIDRNKDTYLINANGHNGATADQKLVSAFDSKVPATIVTVSSDGATVTPISWTQYTELDATTVNSVKAWNYSGNYFDVVAVTLKTSANATASQNAKADIEGITPVIDTNAHKLKGLTASGAKSGVTFAYDIDYSVSGKALTNLNAPTADAGTAGVNVLEASITAGGDTYKRYWKVVSDGTDITSCTEVTTAKANDIKTFVATTYTATYADATAKATVTPTLTAAPAGAVWAFTSGTTATATVGATTGVLTGKAAGDTVVSATVTFEDITKAVAIAKPKATLTTGTSDYNWAFATNP